MEQPKVVDLVLLRTQKEGVELSLADFAAKAGQTEAAFCSRLFDRLISGDMMEILKLEAQCDLGDWITERFLDNKNEFLVVFRLSENKLRDVALFCVCSMNMTAEDPRIYVKHALPGFVGKVPPEAKGLESFEVGFCDMESRI